jgi:hypothetical protein
VESVEIMRATALFEAAEISSFAPGEVVPIPTFWLVSIVIAVVPADWMVRAVEAGLVIVVAVTVPLNVGLAVSATVPVVAGKVIVVVPATAAGVNVIVPEVAPARAKLPITPHSKSRQRIP